MADIVPSLFGLTPGMYQQAQQQRGDEMALQYAKLDPFQQANYAIGRGAYGLAGAAGGLLGGQDPELQRITRRQQIASQINPSDPASIQQGIMALQQAGDTQGAMMLQSEFQKIQESRALIGQREAASIASLAQAGRERTQATPEKIQLAKEIARLAGPEGSPEYLSAYRSSLLGEEKTEKPIVVGNALVNPITGAVIYQSPNEKLDAVVVGGNLVDKSTGKVIFTAPEKPTTEPTTEPLTNARAIAARAGPVGSPEYDAAFNTEYKRLTAEKESKETKTDIQKLQEYAATLKRGSPEFAQVQAKIKALGESGGTKVEIQNLMPGQSVAPKDWMDFTQKVLSNDPVMQRTSTILSDAPSAIEIIRSSTTNDISASSLPGALARLTGEGKNMSNQDVQRFARTGGLDDRLAQDAVKFFTGKATDVKKDQAEKFATALYRGALLERRKKLVDESEQYGYLDSPNYKTALRQIDDKLSQFKLKTKGGSDTPATGGADAEKEARYQAYKRAQEGK